MAPKKLLPDEKIRQVHDAAVRAGLSPLRDALLAGIDDRFKLGLPSAPSPSAQLLNDLMEMNQVTSLTDGTTPLFAWLRTARLFAGSRHEADVFRVALTSAEMSRSASPARPQESAAVDERRLRPSESPSQPPSGGPVRSARWSAPGRVRCFVGYAPQDERFARDLLKHLSPLQRSGVLSVSHPGRVIAGALLDDVTRTLVLEADVILFLTSVDLFDDPNAQVWIDLALGRDGDGVRIIPVLTRPVDLASTPLGVYTPLPGTGDPIVGFKMLDDAYADIARSVRGLVSDRARATVRNTAAVGGWQPVAPGSIADFSEIFSAGTTSELTYVPAVEMDELTAAMSRGRRGLVVQGPSGAGKTTAMRKLVPDERCWLSCIKKGDLLRLDAILDGAPVSGHLVIDEFHTLPPGLRRDVANLIKVTCGERGPDAKITIIGVNNSGEMLFEGNTNLAGRVDFIEIRQRQPERKIEELVRKGEESAQVRFTNRGALVSAARGSFILAQQLCLKALSGVSGREAGAPDVDVHMDELAERVAADLVFFRYPIVEFARLSEAHLLTLWMLSRKTDDELSLQEVKEEFPELDSILEGLIAGRAESAGPLRQYLHIDHRGRVMCNDVQLMFYLARLKDRDWMSVAQDAGRSAYFDEGVLRLARAAPEGGALRRSILDLDVEEFWVRPEASELLAVLCVSYDTFARVSWIASLAGVATDEVTQMGGIRAIWVDLLKAAIRAAKLRTLLVTIQRDETIARYHHKIRGLIS